MIRVVNLKDTQLVTLTVVSDMAYAWLAILDYVPLMRSRIQRNPFSVLRLRATFLKLVSILDAPLVRINQANSPDLSSVSQYYSTEVAAFMRSVLQVIPENMFAILNEVVQINARELKELPVKVVRSELRDWSQLDPRHRLARATHRVSVLTEGVLTMQTTELGVVQVDPEELLEDGIRAELVRQLSHALQSGLQFKPGRPHELEAALERLAAHLHGFHLAFEYLSDYVKLSGLRVWQEELAEVLNFYVEQERNIFLKRRVHAWQSPFTRAAAAANNAPPVAFEHSFFGRLVRELVALCAPKRSIYSEALGGWTDAQGKEILGGRILHLLHSALGRCGLRGVTSTLGFMVTAQLHRFVRVYSSLACGDVLASLDALDRSLGPHTTLPDKPQKQYQAVAGVASKLIVELQHTVSRVGSAQLLRAHLMSSLGGATRIDCSLLSTLLATADAALLAELSDDDHRRARAAAAVAVERSSGPAGARKDGAAAANGLRSPRASLTSSAAPPGGPLDSATGTGSSASLPLALEEAPATALNEAVADLAPYLEAAGLAQPKEQVMLIAPPLPRLPLALAVFTQAQLGRLQWSNSMAALTEPKGKLTEESIDGVTLVTGVACVLRQFHADATTSYVGYLTQHVRALLHGAFAAAGARLSEPPAEAVTLIHYLELFARHAGVDVPGLDLYQTAVGS